jgi:hypothetical protein
MNDSSPPQVPLDYAPGAPIRRRRRLRRVLIALIVVVIAAAAWWKGPGIYHHAMVLYYLHEARVYSAPADQVVYEEDPAREAELLKLPHYHLFSSDTAAHNSYVAYWAPPLESLVKANWRGAYPPAFFIHALRSPAGHKRLVMIWVGPNPIHANATGASPDNQVMVLYDGSVIDGTTSKDISLQDWLAPMSVAEHRSTPLYLRFYAGQPDATDPSHFTIPYRIGDYSDVLDGYLEDDDNIALFPRKHRAFDQSQQEKARQRINKRNQPLHDVKDIGMRKP